MGVSFGATPATGVVVLDDQTMDCLTPPQAAGAQDPPPHDHQVVPSDVTLRVKAIESLLVDKGLVDRAALDVIVDAFETKIGPRNGARIVARAWVDPAYKTRLLTDATAAIAESRS